MTGSSGLILLLALACVQGASVQREPCREDGGECLAEDEVASNNLLMKTKRVTMLQDALKEDDTITVKAKKATLRKEDIPLAPVPKASFNGVCPSSHPWAYRPTRNLDYCCRTPNDKSGTPGRNGLEDRSLRAGNCEGNGYTRCPSPPCNDNAFAIAGGKVYSSNCPESHPYAYRPAQGLDYCCKTADDNSGNVGINSLADKDARSGSCKWHQYSRCPSKPCADFGEALGEDPTAGGGSEWHFLDHFPGTFVQCGAADHIKCASDDGTSCLWGNFGGDYTAYETVKSLLANKTMEVACPGWPTADGSDPCETLSCYANGAPSTPAPAPAAAGKCAPLVLPGYQVGACSDLAPGQSCEVSCPSDLKGFPVRYTCFSALAAAGRPPAALRLPQCYTPTNFLFAQAGNTKLQWLEHEGCLKCSSWRQCTLEVVPNNGNSTCTSFAISKSDGETFYRFKTDGNQCLSLSSWIDIPKLGLWGCSGAHTQKWLVEPSPEREGGWQFCVSDYWRGKACVNPQGLPSKYAHVKPDAVTAATAISAMAAGDNATFFKQAEAIQVCAARMDATGVPDTFWEWLKTQDHSLKQALFATFPASPGQMKMFHEIREAVGHDNFQGMESFAVALAYLNRNKNDLDENVQVPHPIYERNNNGFTDDERDEVTKEYEDGVRFHNPSCDGWASWNFSWPRQPSPSIRQWIDYWQRSIVDRSGGLWENPVEAVPWHFGVYLWPSPLEECEWVRRVVLDGETMVGRWYHYTFGYYDNICAGEGPYGDSLMGIAEYGGVCDRMAELEWRKSGCMGMPAQQKSEPGHWAGFKFASKSGKFTKLNAITDHSNTYTIQLVPPQLVTLDWVEGTTAFPGTVEGCLSCPSSNSLCSVVTLDSGACTQFAVDAGSKRIRAVDMGQCLDMFGGPKPGVWSCGGGTNVNQDFTENAEGELVITSHRGSIRLRTHKVPDTAAPTCLKCSNTYQLCTHVPQNSSECTHFMHDEEGKLIRNPATGQCVDMFGGPKVGTWSCSSGSANQRVEMQADGSLVISASRGTLTFQRFSVAADTSEYGRCLVCGSAWRDCTFESADSDACTEFRYDETTQQVRLQQWNQCLYTKGPQTAALWGCDSASNVGDAQRAVVQDGMLVMTKNGLKMQLVVPGQTPIPPTTTRWAADFYHVVDCQKGNCHYPSALTLDSREMFDWRHGEAAISAADAYNDHEKKGLWPTAHDEARLAASFAYFFHTTGQVPAQDLEPVLAWALKRNPDLYDAWELAATFPTSGLLNSSGMPQRADQKSRQWYERLSLLSISRTQASAEAHDQAQARADRFAREHLAGEEARRRWAKRPQLLQSLVGSLCGALSEPVLEELGEASAQCRLVRQLASGEAWHAVDDDTLEADATGTGNLPSEAFMMRWEAMMRIAMVDGHEGQTAKLAEAVKYLLAHLTVGYVNERAETFFVKHGRVVMRGPYAHTLQLAAMVLPESDRRLLLNATKDLLERPWENPDRLLASPEALKETFLQWVSYHHPSRGAVESASVSDSVDGFLSTDAAGPEVMKEMQLDRDEQVEQGAGADHPTTTDQGADAAERYDVVKLLERLLGLELPKADETSAEDLDLLATEGQQPSKGHSALAQHKARRLAGQDPNEVLRMCVDDLLAV